MIAVIEEGIEILLVGLQDRPPATKYCGTPIEEESATFTKYVTISLSSKNYNIQSVLLNVQNPGQEP